MYQVTCQKCGRLIDRCRCRVRQDRTWKLLGCAAALLVAILVLACGMARFLGPASDVTLD